MREKEISKTIFIISIFLLIISPNFIQPVNSTSNIKNQFDPQLTQLDPTNISSIFLASDFSEIEFGSELNITYYFLNSTGDMLSDVPYMILLFEGITSDTMDYTLDNSTSLLNSTSTGNQEQYKLDTLPSNMDPLFPGDYSIIIRTDFDTSGQNYTNIQEILEFDVYPNEGASIDVAFNHIGRNEELIPDTPYTVSRGVLNQIEIVITNVGSGNAVDLDFNLTGTNEPIIITSEDTSISESSLTAQAQIRFTMSIVMQELGIAELFFRLTFNDTLEVRRSTDYNLIFQNLPIITGGFVVDDPLITNENNQLDIQIINWENNPIDLSIYVETNGFSTIEDETGRIPVNSGVNEIEFVAISFTNGTYDASLYVRFFDPLDDDFTSIFINQSSITFVNQPPEQFTPVTQTLPDSIVFLLFALYSIPIIVFIIFFLRKDLRKSVINRIVSSGLVSDIDYTSDKVIVDGSNVAWEALTPDGKPKVSNIKKAIEKLKKYGFKEIIVVVDAALRYQISDPSELDKEVSKGLIKVLPAKVDGDSFILRLSRDFDALILTNDLYKEYRNDFKFIDKRRIPYTIIDGVVYLHPLYEL